MQAPPIQKQKWPLGFCDCCSYKDAAGNSNCIPVFIPKAVCGTCFLVGESLSHFENEDIKCCNMGTKGICCCIISVPINIAGPLGGFCWFAMHSVKMRADTVARYNIDDSAGGVPCCCFTLPEYFRSK